ncbi:DUF2789 family protein [Reinekea blandensis]|uniref:DUF2789 domain-containing protein n=1 Tax=Reinekea blandensis MED297 TaxID=314283 RepID=A4B8U6_9GAMM|nr:DUF2789 family protein [Reinekea blandensis]EAR11047.1 hypothetical protein MED297_19207 [Reinekea sp. MED297] [Reinekea blandensis MED297]
MQANFQSLRALFGQLGLPDDDTTIAQFIEKNRINDPDTPLESLSVWSESQKQFLLEARSLDAEWAEPVDELDALLHQ